ncbi:MAG: hypothetical protein ACRDK4_03640 [Solirubrobacteraceae bacterium]
MFETELNEVEVALAAQLAGIDPFVLRDRLLIRAFSGRCCFELGMAMKCADGSMEIKEGDRKDLQLSVASHFLGARISTSYTFERKFMYTCGLCDSVAPVLVFDDSYIHIYEVRNWLTGLASWKRNETIFHPTKRPFLASNKVLDAPECGCAKTGPPTASVEDQVSLAAKQLVTRLAETISFTPEPIAEQTPDPRMAASQALVALEEFVAPFQKELPEEVGIVDLHGDVTWFGDPISDEPLPKVAVISTDCNAVTRGTLAVGMQQDHYPVLAVTPARNAAWGRLSVELQEDPGKFVHYEDWDLTIASDTVTVAAGAVDFSEFTSGAAGEIKIELFDTNDQLAAMPITEPFVVVTEPAISGQLLDQPQEV